MRAYKCSVVYLVSMLFCILSCKQKNDSYEYNKRIITFKDSLRLKVEHIINLQGHELVFEIESYNFFGEVGGPDIRVPPRISQKLWLSSDTSDRIEIPLPNGKISTILVDKNMEILTVEISVDRIIIIKSDHKFMFMISGYGGCFSCKEFEALYTINGILIESYIADQDSTYQYFINEDFLYKKTNLKESNMKDTVLDIKVSNN